MVVAKESRPFDLRAGRMIVHDFGTGFIVDRRDGSVRVTVTDGVVRVVAPIDSETRMRLQRGEPETAWKAVPDRRKFNQVEFDERLGELHTLPGATELELQQLQAFEEGRILLDGRTLAGAIHELNRYQKLPRFEFSAGTGATLLGGDIAFNNLNGFLLTIESQFHIHHTTRHVGSDTVIVLTGPGKK